MGKTAGIAVLGQVVKTYSTKSTVYGRNSSGYCHPNPRRRTNPDYPRMLTSSDTRLKATALNFAAQENTLSNLQISRSNRRFQHLVRINKVTIKIAVLRVEVAVANPSALRITMRKIVPRSSVTLPRRRPFCPNKPVLAPSYSSCRLSPGSF